MCNCTVDFTGPKGCKCILLWNFIYELKGQLNEVSLVFFTGLVANSRDMYILALCLKLGDFYQILIGSYKPTVSILFHS